MNGEVNGTMEEPMETSSLPPSPVHMKSGSAMCSMEVTMNHCVPSTNIDNSNSNHWDSDGNQMTNSNDGLSTNEHSNDSNVPNQEHDIKKSLNTVSNNENGNETVDNHYSNSNESYPESLEGSQIKSDQNSALNPENLKKPSEEGGSEKEVSDDEVDSEEDSSEDDGSDVSEEPRAEDTVSINSDSCDGSSQDSRQSKHITNDVVIAENNGNHTDNPHSPEVHEIISDNEDCILTNDEKTNSSSNETKNDLRRRSSRGIKRKRYDDEDTENGEEESDIEEVAMEDPLNQYNEKKTIIVNDKISLLDMSSKQKTNLINNEKKEPTVVIIDTNSILSGKGSQGKNVSNTALNAQNLYESIAARGTTVTPVSNKNLTNSSAQSAQQMILPSLTDDMFVVEAPSFIVPYVYEKPSLKPFREFVDSLRKELDDLKAKEEQERLEKEKQLKELNKDKEIEKNDEEKEVEKEKESENDSESENENENENENEKGKEKDKVDKVDKVEEMEVVEPLEEETVSTAEEAEEGTSKKKKADKKDRKKRGNDDDDDVSWDGESSEDSDDEVISDDEEKTVVIKEKDDSIDEIKTTITNLTTDKISGVRSDNYFDCSLGKFFINIGLNLVQEYVQNDLLKQQNRKLYKEKKTGGNTRGTETAIASLTKNLEFSKENNAPYSFKQKKCEFCSFKTESMLSMSHHLETPHMKNNIYKCNYCAFEIRSPHDILYHMEAEHNIRGRLERAPAYHQCANCPFEDNGKGKLARHLIPCAKKFKPDLNLAPPIEWEPPAKIPKITRARNNMIGGYQSPFNRAQMGNNIGRPPMNVVNMMPGAVNNYRARGRSPMAVPPRAAPVHGTPVMRGGVMVRHNAPSPVLMPNNYPIMQNNQSLKNATNSPKLLHHQPSISITPLPRPQQPPQPQTSLQSKGTFVICEICDGYIKDLEQLRNHMQWIHKVKIHPKMIYNRPPLNCQKCQFRFFTDQGLERHLLGSHGLVTSSMQEAANKGKDAGRCPVCGRVYQWKLLNHVAKDHSLTLKPAHLSYKCTVCTATFGMYKQFENHVYSAHSVVAKRVMDKTKATTSAPKTTGNDSLLKPLKINDEITIIPQPAKSATPPTSTKDK